MVKALNIEIGTRFGLLTVIAAAPDRRSSSRAFRYWLCRCDCGTEKQHQQASLRHGTSRSCGCLKRRARTHGLGGRQTRSSMYWIWKAMIARCESTRRRQYHNYGGRGISVCDRWRHGDGRRTGVECFIADMGPKPSPQHSVDRRDNDGNYEPGNCRWATPLEQTRNRRISIRKRARLNSAPIPKAKESDAI